VVVVVVVAVVVTDANAPAGVMAVKVISAGAFGCMVRRYARVVRRVKRFARCHVVAVDPGLRRGDETFQRPRGSGSSHRRRPVPTAWRPIFARRPFGS